MKKLISTILLILVLTVSVAVAAACGGTEDGEKSGFKTYTMEAEYTDLTGVYGGGHSAEATGVDMIYGDGTDAQKEMGWSSGYFVAFTHKEGVKLTFRFESSAAVSNATIELRVGSEMGELTFTPQSFEISLNGETIDYGNMTVANSPVLGEMKFYDKTISNSAALKKGENILTLTVLANELAGGTTAGPIIDCVKITTSATLKWNDKTDNPANRGSI